MIPNIYLSDDEVEANIHKAGGIIAGNYENAKAAAENAVEQVVEWAEREIDNAPLGLRLARLEGVFEALKKLLDNAEKSI